MSSITLKGGLAFLGHISFTTGELAGAGLDGLWTSSGFIDLLYTFRATLKYKIRIVYNKTPTADTEVAVLAAYDENKNYLPNFSKNGGFTGEYIPDDSVRYIRISGSPSDIDVTLSKSTASDSIVLPVPTQDLITSSAFQLEKLKNNVSSLENYVSSIENNVSSLENNVDYSKLSDTILCDGDSLTWGDLGSKDGNNQAEHNYPAVLQSLLGDRFVVVNCGIPGAPSSTIVANATGYTIRDEVTIPAEKNNDVLFRCSMFKSIDNVESWTFTPVFSHHGSGSIQNPCYINGIKGTIIGIKKLDSDGEYYAIFRRAENGDATSVKKGDMLLVNETLYKRDCTHIIHIGTNGGYVIKNSTPASEASINELIEQYDMIIRTSSKLYIVMSSHTFIGSSGGAWAGESKFENKFGIHYLNLRKYYSTTGIQDALDRGYLINSDTITYPTEADTAAMNSGKTPPSLLSGDKFHLNDVGYHLLGDLVYKKYLELRKSKILGTL